MPDPNEMTRALKTADEAREDALEPIEPPVNQGDPATVKNNAARAHEATRWLAAEIRVQRLCADQNAGDVAVGIEELTAATNVVASQVSAVAAAITDHV